ncbi:MAG TPA: FAD-dependent oxidoreductase [Armatimonadota bacterium]|nr:FAD-dependent oxidoreductase [Armatimonadota bacterium]HOM81950.1 FAD-dependent oxidoreductase [Armatimonadota bacterium]HPO74387.1 FAD-dependent oxidoreductase [Armatimonadota bacterium]HPT99712.1 FAD-dependent oxidoreductase [Armatimonadota bacterium]
MSDSGSVMVPAEKVPVLCEVDLLVCGGGPAGVCAAVAAARAGARVLLVERHGFFGGMTTAGGVTIWHSLYSTDGETQVIGGLVQELVERLERRGAARNSRSDGRGYFVVDTEYAKLVFDELVRDAGVVPLLHAWAAGVVMDGPRVAAVLMQSKSGRQAVRARVVVDATGDGDVAALAGAPFEKGDAQGLMQPPGLCFRIGGVDRRRANEEGFKTGAVMRALNRPMDYNGQEYPCFLWTTESLFRDDELLVAGARVTEVDATDVWSFTRAEMEGRQQMEWVLKRLREEVPGFEKAYLAGLPAQIGIRETRRILGEHLLQEQELLEGVRFPDAIAQGTYPVDIHNPRGRGIVFKHLDGRWREVLPDGSRREGTWTPDGQVQKTPCYQVPYGVLVPRKVENLLVAGRCISATHEAHGAIRVMVNCMQFGQAAGAAAALCVREGYAPRELPAPLLRRLLLEQGCCFLGEG